MRLSQIGCLAWASTTLLATACGVDHGGYLYEAGSVQVGDERGHRGDFALTESAYTKINWFFQCPSAPVPPPTPGSHELVLEGPGPHQIARERVVGTPVILSGKVCSTRSYLRDIVIAIDVSGSMGMPGGDPMVSGSCNRLRAVQNLLADLPADTKVGVFTFGDEVEVTSNLAASRDAALNAIGTGDALANALCSFRGGSSDFNVAMDESSRMLSSGRADQAAKELYIISDGNEQTAGNPPQTHARDLAKSMRTTGIDIGGEKIKAQIGALQVSGTPRHPIFPDLVSADTAGAALLYPVADSARLASTIGGTSRNALDHATIGMRVASTGTWDNHDLKPLIAADAFALAPLQLAIDEVQTGYEVQLDYADIHGAHVHQAGSLVWND